GMQDLKKVGRVGGKALIYFEIISTLSLIIGLLDAPRRRGLSWLRRPSGGHGRRPPRRRLPRRPRPWRLPPA
ncbi:MAG: hypothetical protein E2602_20840, partial [Achromobacter sp.]|nr:hypothetical protein [Achromobacter sp.]